MIEEINPVVLEFENRKKINADGNSLLVRKNQDTTGLIRKSHCFERFSTIGKVFIQTSEEKTMPLISSKVSLKIK